MYIYIHTYIYIYIYIYIYVYIHRVREEVEEVSGEEERLEPREPDPRRRWNARLHRVERLL